MPTRSVTYAGGALALEYSGAATTRLVEFLFQHLPKEEEGAARLTYRLHGPPAETQFRIFREEFLLYTGQSEATAAESLLGDMCHHLAVQSRDGLLFHAAGLAWDDCGIILPGTTGAGKSTLAAWLTAKGFNYLTDELVYIPWQTTKIQGFPRPLNLKLPWRTALGSHFNAAKQPSGALTTPQADLILPTLLNPTNQISEPSLDLIIFPNFQPAQKFSLKSLSKAQAGLILMQHLVNARNLSGHGFSEVIRLVKTVPAYQLTYPNFDKINDRLEGPVRRACQNLT